MHLAVAGLNHRTSEVDLLERLVFPSERLEQALRAGVSYAGGGAMAILSTCNRVELYAHGSGGAAGLMEKLGGFLSDWHGVARSRLEPSLFRLEGVEAVRHLFRVAAGLDSLVVGETQILGQVHDAYLAAQRAGTTDKVLSAMFQRAFSAAKRARTDTGVGEGSVSIGSVAVDLAVRHFRKLNEQTVLVVGSGRMGEAALKSLLDRGAARVLVSNRSEDRAHERARAYGGEVVPFEELKAALPMADIVITSTSAPGHILERSDFERSLKARDGKGQVVIDIALPRDAEPAIRDVGGVELYDMDGLREVAEENLSERRGEIERCQEIVDHGVERFACWLRGLAAEPTIVSMIQECNAIRQDELDKTLASLPGLTDTERETVSHMTKRIVNRILQQPMSQLKQEVAGDDPDMVLRLVNSLFGLEQRR